MDLINNSVGLVHGQTVSPIYWTVNQIADSILAKLNNGELQYLSPIWPAKFNKLGILSDPNGDPNYWGTGGILQSMINLTDQQLFNRVEA